VARLLVCVPGVPHKSRGASSVLFYHYIDQLKRAGFSVLCLLLIERGTRAERDVAVFQDEIAEPGRCEVEAADVDHLLNFDRLTGTPRPGTLPPGPRQRALEFNADRVLCFDLGALAVARHAGLGRRWLAWLGDLAYQSLWAHAKYDAMEDWRAVFRLPKIWLICRRWRAAYRQLLADAELVVVSSGSSEAAVKALGVPAARYLPYPWPVDKPYRSAAAGGLRAGQPCFLFCGTLSGLGSRSALHYLLDVLYPELLRLWGHGGFRILITGARALPQWAMASIAGKAEIAFEGFVDDLYARMDQCHAAIVPIDVPVGNRSRIITAMGYGLLVIAHSNTALGNPALVSGETCLLAEAPADFARHMKSAYDDPLTAARIERAAREAYERLFAPQAAGLLLVEQMKALA
jgi:glycosyltransferase involved in cell wall biosynthesis